jgi:amino acid adenylation domain-containing protein
MVLLAAFQTLLHRYTRQEDIIVGSPVAGRTRLETEPLIGFFVNTLVLRTNFEGNPSFREVVARVRDVTLDAQAHQEVPFEKLVEELRPERHTNRTPLFQVMFILQNLSGSAPTIPGLSVEPVDHGHVAAKFDLTLTLTEDPVGLKGALVYNSDLFDAVRMDRMAKHFETLLYGVANNPDRRIGYLPVLTDNEKVQLDGWNETDDLGTWASAVHVLVEEQVRQTPDAVALIVADEHFTYRELNSRANALAQYLRSLGVRPETLVGLCVERSHDMAVAVLAVLKAGGAYMPLDPEFPLERLAKIIAEAHPAIVLTQKKLRTHLPTDIGRAVYLDSDELLLHDSSENPANRSMPDNLAYVIYTSGSTGQPKGVAMCHRALVNLIRWQQSAWKKESAVPTLQFASINFDVSFQEMFSTWASGGTLVLASEDERRDPHRLARLIADRKIARAFLPPIVLQHLAETSAGPAPTTLREVITAGEQLKITSAVIEYMGSVRGRILYNHYGPTEAHVVTAHTLSGPPDSWPVLPPIGSPIANARIYLLDRYGQRAPVGIPAELYIGGLCLARGYLNNPRQTAERFIPDSFTREPGARLYRTGDLARYRADGSIEFLGRTDHQVKIRGFRIELGEIEDALCRHPQIREAVVVARTFVDRDTRLCAYLVAREGAAPTPCDIREFLGTKLPAYMIPHMFITLEALPLTSTGKVDRNKLPAPNDELTTSDGLCAEVRTPWEAQLAIIWEELLGESVGRDDNFFELGGHSMLAVRLMARIKSAFGKTLPLVALFHTPKLAQMAEAIRTHDAHREWPTLAPVQPAGARPPLFCVARPNVNALGYAFLARCLGTNQPLYVLQAQFREETIKPYSQAEYSELAHRYIRAMRAAQRNGPYSFVGLCEGAHIGFEMARVLEAQGEQIALLAMLDTWTLENTRSLMYTVHDCQRRLRAVLKTGARELGARALRAILRVVRDCALPRKSQDSQSISSRRNFWNERYFPGKDFVPTTVTAPITVFRIRKQPYWRISDPELGWGNRTQSNVEVHIIPGEHLTVLRPPNVQVLAKILIDCIARARRHDGPEAMVENGAIANRRAGIAT